MKLKDKIAIVTASTKGIGLAISLKLANEGAVVYLAARNESLVNEIIQNNKNLKLNFVYFDATKIETYSSMIEQVYQKEKRIDILVNNFGVSNPKEDKTIFDTSVEYFSDVVQKNLLSVFIPCQTAIKYMKEQKSGSIINISTIGSLHPDIARIGYVTSKAAINTLTQNIALHVGNCNIRCNAVLPGMTRTPALENNMSEEFIKLFSKTIPLGKIGEPEDIANMVAFLAGDESQYITGQIIEVAGGFGKSTPIYPLFNK